MKILLVAISMVLILGGPVFASGSSRNISYQGQSSGPILSSNVVINTRGTDVYNLTLNAYSALATLTIYDTPTGPVANGEIPVYEVEVASAGDSRSVDFSTAPIQTYNGLVATVTNGVAYLNVEK